MILSMLVNHPKLYVLYNPLLDEFWMIYKHAQNHPKVDHTNHPNLDAKLDVIYFWMILSMCKSLSEGRCLRSSKCGFVEMTIVNDKRTTKQKKDTLQMQSM